MSSNYNNLLTDVLYLVNLFYVKDKDTSSKATVQEQAQVLNWSIIIYIVWSEKDSDLLLTDVITKCQLMLLINVIW